MNKISEGFKRLALASKLKKKGTVVKNALHTSSKVLSDSLGKEVYLGKDVRFIGDISDLSIGDYTYINGAYIYDGVHIGKCCSMGFDICLGPGEHYLDRLSTYPVPIRVLGMSWDNVFPKNKETVIGNDVWIGHGAVVLGGVSVGDGAVIAAGSVVTKDVAPYSVVAGVPAKVVRERFDDETKEKLKALKWWDKDYSWIADNMDLFYESGNKLKEDIGALI